MTDAKARRIILRWVYDNRRQIAWTNCALDAGAIGGGLDQEDVDRIGMHLVELGLIEGQRYANRRIMIRGLTARGIDEIEVGGHASYTISTSPSVTVHHDNRHTVNVGSINGVAQIGNHNTTKMDYDKLKISVLTWLKNNRGKEAPNQLTMSTLGIKGDPEMLSHTLLDLFKDGLIDGVPIYDADARDVLTPVIKEKGIQALEGPTPSSQTFNIQGPITGGNVQFGNHNTQNVNVHLQAIVESVQASQLPSSEKKRLLSHLYTFASDPALGNALQMAALIGEAIKNLG